MNFMPKTCPYRIFHHTFTILYCVQTVEWHKWRSQFRSSSNSIAIVYESLVIFTVASLTDRRFFFGVTAAAAADMQINCQLFGQPDTPQQPCKFGAHVMSNLQPQQQQQPRRRAGGRANGRRTRRWLVGWHAGRWQWQRRRDAETSNASLLACWMNKDWAQRSWSVIVLQSLVLVAEADAMPFSNDERHVLLQSPTNNGTVLHLSSTASWYFLVTTTASLTAKW